MFNTVLSTLTMHSSGVWLDNTATKYFCFLWKQIRDSFRIISSVTGPHVIGSFLENTTINDAFLQSIIVQILTKYQSGCGLNDEL